MSSTGNIEKSQISILRAEVDDGLRRLEAAGGGIDAAAIQLIKLGIALSCATLGPEETINGLERQVDQLSDLRFGRDFPPVQGSA